MSGKYDDIIMLPHPEPRNHPRMSMRDRAAQFAPFSALTGHSAAIAEAGRLTGERIELDESKIAQVDAELQRLQGMLSGKPTVSVTYFQPDEKKDGGSYQTLSGIVRKIDHAAGSLIFFDRREISIDAVIEIHFDG